MNPHRDPASNLVFSHKACNTGERGEKCIQIFSVKFEAKRQI
jgi:hypothetical protein